MMMKEYARKKKKIYAVICDVFLSLFCVYITRVCFKCDLRVYDDDDDDDDDSGTSNSPCSYRQPTGNGQSFARRYCKHSERLCSCAICTASEFHGALAVSRKYFKQSK